MSLPASVQQHIELALVAIRSDPQHEMSPLRRRAIYEAFTTPPVPTTPHWLAVITSRRLLPRFQEHYPEDTFPQEILTMALDVLHGVRTKQSIPETVLEQGHHCAVDAWCHDEREIPWPVWLAGSTTYFALTEVLEARPPLGFLPDYYKENVLTPWTDKKLCEFFFCDTAGAAAIASASDRHGQTIDPGQLLAFWKWWLTDAMFAAYQSVLQGQLSSEV